MRIAYLDDIQRWALIDKHGLELRISDFGYWFMTRQAITVAVESIGLKVDRMGNVTTQDGTLVIA